MPRQQRHTIGGGSLIFRALMFADRKLFPGLKMRSFARRGERFQDELQAALASLLMEHGGTVRILRPKQIPPFGYLAAVAEFPDRKLTFVRGRSEFYASIETEGRERCFFSTSMPSGSGKNGKDGGALSRCATLLQQHWAELPGASDAEVARFDMQARESKPLFEPI